MRNPAMTEQDENRRAKDIMTAGGRAGIPISEENARLAAKSSDSLYNAFEVVRSLEYQDHEPSNVFNPVLLRDGSEEESDR